MDAWSIFAAGCDLVRLRLIITRDRDAVCGACQCNDGDSEPPSGPRQVAHCGGWRRLGQKQTRSWKHGAAEAVDGGECPRGGRASCGDMDHGLGLSALATRAPLSMDWCMKHTIPQLPVNALYCSSTQLAVACPARCKVHVLPTCICVDAPRRPNGTTCLLQLTLSHGSQFG